MDIFSLYLGGENLSSIERLLKNDKDVIRLLSEEEIDELFDLNKILININKIYKRLELKI